MRTATIAIVLACLPLVGCVGADDSIFARLGVGGAGGAAGGSSSGGAAAGSGASGGTVAATGGAISAGSGTTTWIPGCTVAAGESWSKCQTTVDGQGVTAAPASVPTVPSAQMQVDLSNIPGVQEVHFVMSKAHCKALFDKLRREGQSFNSYDFYRAGMPGARDQGHCKLSGPDAIDNRFTDTRYEKDN